MVRSHRAHYNIIKVIIFSFNCVFLKKTIFIIPLVSSVERLLNIVKCHEYIR